MAKETQIGQLVIDLKIRTEALEKGLETAKKKLQEIETQNEQVKNSNKGLDASFIAMSVTTVASLVKIKSALDDAIAEYTKYKNSMMTVNRVAQNTGNTLKDVQKIINESNEYKLMNESDLNAAIKNLLLYGYTAEQATDILKRLQDSAVGNRQECYSLSEAVRVTTEGIRMENSVTSDAAGVQKNIAKMYEEHAEKLGKTTDSLTQAEKAQAVYNGIMEETAPIVGSAAEIAGQYEGQQAQANAELLKTKQLIGESLVPTYTELSKAQKNILSGLNKMIKDNKSATAGIITFTTALLASTIAVKAAQKAVTSFSTATGIANTTTKALTASLMANPLFWGGLAISAGVSALNAFNTEMQNAIDKMEEATQDSLTSSELLTKFKENWKFTDEEATQAEDLVAQTKEDTKKIIADMEERKKEIARIEEEIQNKKPYDPLLEARLEAQKAIVEDCQSTLDLYNSRVEALTMCLDYNSTRIEYNTVMNAKASRQKLIDIAQTKADIAGKQQLLDILKKGKTSTDEYADAKSQLVKQYPELARVNENTIASTQAAIDAENKMADIEWANAQTTIQTSLIQAQAMATNYFQIQNIAVATGQKIEEVTASLQNQISVLSNLAKLTPEDFKGSIDTSTYKPKVNKSGSNAYQNKALDNYKKQIEYKKSLDQISLREEINMYEIALKRYAKTQDEKMELTTKLYQLRKELQEKTLDDYASQIEYEKNMGMITTKQEVERYEYAYETYAKTTEQKKELEQQLYDLRKQLADEERELINQKTDDYKRYIEEQKNLRGAEYDVKEQEKDLNKIIELHKNYLNQVMRDERYTLAERENIYREELDIIRDYEQQKRDARVSSINDTVSQLKSAITKQIEEMEKADEEAINKNIEAVEKWKDTRIEAINEEYEARIKAIQDELAALDKAEEDKSRAEEDAEYKKKKRRLEELIAYEHDATTKANYVKELTKLEQEYQKTINKRVLQDKKDALKEQQELLKEEQSSKIDAIEEDANKQKEAYETQLDNLKEYYNKQKDIAQETAEKMLLNVEQNQNQILNLLNKYGDKYEITGQSLGEKLAQGINNGLSDKIQNIIQSIQDRIDGAIESQISKWTNASYKYEQATAKAQAVSNSVVINQTNNIENNPEMPSETYRKLNNVSRELAAELTRI